MSKLFNWLVILLCTVQLSANAATPLKPLNDSEVIEVLPTITRNRPGAPDPTRSAADPRAAAIAAQQSISLARQTGDNRYWGRAQAVLTPWWDRSDAPIDLAILQATVQQGRHEFEASRKVLAASLARHPAHAQGWLTMATLERLSGRYTESLAACREVANAGQALYAEACSLETHSLMGDHGKAAKGLAQLAAQAETASQQSWLFSLLAESQERAGQDALALSSFQRSLSREPDLYTAIGLADLLLRTGQSAAAIKVLSTYPETDAVLLRRAIAMRRLGDAQWRIKLTDFQGRVADLRRRGDDPLLHGRELAMSALWLEDDAPRALVLAKQNLLLQREPVDWYMALVSAQRAGDKAASGELAAALKRTGLKDARLDVLVLARPQILAQAVL
jgi:tetratricopeptide (TPR) repeat protein